MDRYSRWLVGAAGALWIVVAIALGHGWWAWLGLVPLLLPFGDLVADRQGVVEVDPKFETCPIGLGAVVEVRRVRGARCELVLDVETQEGTAFRGWTEIGLGRSARAELAPGTRWPVRYDPDAADGKVLLVTDAKAIEAQVLDARVTVDVAQGRMTEAEGAVWRTGLTTTATISAARTSAVLDGAGSIMALTLTVTRPDDTTFEIEAEDAFPTETAARLVPGHRMRVRYALDDESMVILLPDR